MSFTDAQLHAVIQSTSDLKQTTKGPYIANLNTIVRACNKGSTTSTSAFASLFQIIKDPATYFPRLQKTTPNPATLRTLVKTILALLKFTGIKENQPYIYKPWYSHFIDLSRITQKAADNNVATPATDMTWSEVLEKRSALTPGTIEHVTIAMYTMIPPRRQQDYWKIQVFLDEKEEPSPQSDSTGHLDLTGSPGSPNQIHTMTITAFKTHDKYSDYVASIPPDLVKAITLYMSTQKKPSGSFLFTKNNGEPYSTLSSFTDANNKVIKRALHYPPACVNTIRHAMASYVATSSQLLLSQKKKVAKAMGHSFMMQQRYTVARPEGDE